MSEQKSSTSCALNCCIMGCVAGLVFAAVFFVIADYTAMQAAFAGVVVAIGVAILVGFFTCGKSSSVSGDAQADTPKGQGADTSATKAAAAAAPATAAAPGAAAAMSGAAPAAAPAETEHAQQDTADEPARVEVKPSKELPGQKELADRKGDWKYEAEPTPDAPAKEAAASPVTEGQPELLSSPRAGQAADDLKLISGVGPKLEQTLNELGFYHFDQIASWTKQEIEWVDSRLRFKGRIERDDWMSQAKTLAEGGETEFSKRKKK